jgi:[cytochrome c]-lysine N-methyltransferase
VAMLIDPQCRIAGVAENTALEQWLAGDALATARDVVVKQSSLGGVGLFYSGDGATRELLRIKRKYDYNELLQQLSALDSDSAAIVKLALTVTRPSTETAILQCYVVAFYICLRLRPNSMLQYRPYLDVLCNTHVGDIDEPTPNSRYFSNYVARRTKQERKYNELMAALAPSCSSEVLTLGMFRQIEAAVRSRVLEIPYADDNDEDSYTTNVTLVPLLDFVNHTSEPHKNAYFDIDRATGDILLMLQRDVAKGDEITICYSPNENIQQLAYTYGFVPDARPDSVQLFEIVLPGDFLDSYLHNPNMHKILKWLQIFAQVQLVLMADKVYINYFANTLPLAFVEGYEYQDDWLKPLEKSNSDIVESIRLQEHSYDVVIGVDQVAVKLRGEYPTAESVLELAGMETETHLRELQKQCTKMVHHYCQQTIDDRLQWLSQQPAAATSLLIDYCRREVEVYKMVTASYERGDDLTLPETLAQDDWEAERTPPRFYH